MLPTNSNNIFSENIKDRIHNITCGSMSNETQISESSITNCKNNCLKNIKTQFDNITQEYKFAGEKTPLSKLFTSISLVSLSYVSEFYLTSWRDPQNRIAYWVIEKELRAFDKEAETLKKYEVDKQVYLSKTKKARAELEEIIKKEKLLPVDTKEYYKNFFIFSAKQAVCLPAYALLVLVSLIETCVRATFFIIAKSLELLTCSKKSSFSDLFAGGTLISAITCGKSLGCIFFNFFKKPIMSHTKFTKNFLDPCEDFAGFFLKESQLLS